MNKNLIELYLQVQTSKSRVSRLGRCAKEVFVSREILGTRSALRCVSKAIYRDAYTGYNGHRERSPGRYYLTIESRSRRFARSGTPADREPRLKSNRVTIMRSRLLFPGAGIRRSWRRISWHKKKLVAESTKEIRGCVKRVSPRQVACFRRSTCHARVS